MPGIRFITVMKYTQNSLTIMRSSYRRSHYELCPAVCLSVCPMPSPSQEQKVLENQKLPANVVHATNDWWSRFEVKSLKVNMLSICLWHRSLKFENEMTHKVRI